jgi:hypothetical protein
MVAGVTARRFTPLRTDDADLTRVQDAIARVVNAPATVPVYPLGGRPAAAAALGGVLIRIHATGQPDRLQTCLQNSDGSWGWVDCALASR